MVTIKEIAQRSGYSPATVSRLLNNDQTLSVTQTTRNKILKVANQLGYWKDRKKPAVAPTIALLFRMNNQEQLQDSYFASLKDALLKTIEDAGMQVKVFQYVEELIDQAEEFQGFLCVGDDNVELNVFKRLHRLLPAGVFVDTDPLPHLFDSVQPNLSMTVRDALEQFADAGYQRIAFIGGIGPQIGKRPRQRDSRETAFRVVAEELEFKQADVFSSGSFSVLNGRQLGEAAIKQYGDQLPEGFLIASDTLSVGVLQAFNDAGVIVPRDTSIISINNSDIAEYVSPPLSTYNINQKMISRMALNILRDAIANPERPHVHALVDTNLIMRESFKLK